jgi:threonine/homoserine/homoserine lactone efflux protein
MPSADAFLAFSVLSFLLIAVPGPSVLFTISRALTVGRRAALLTVLGNAVGVYAQVVAVAVGIGALLERSVEVFTVVKLVGAGYLIYLGVQAIRKRNALAFDPEVTPKGTTRVLADGFVVGFANPKSIVFLALVLPQYLPGARPVEVLVLGAVFPLIALVSDSLWAMVAGTARAWFAKSPRRLALLGGTGGAVMIGLGVKVAFTSKAD